MLSAMELTTVKPADYDEAKAIINRCSFLLGRCQLLKSYFDAHKELSDKDQKLLFKDLFLLDGNDKTRLPYLKDCAMEALNRGFANLCLTGSVHLNKTSQDCVMRETVKYNPRGFTAAPKVAVHHPELVEELGKLTHRETYTP